MNTLRTTLVKIRKTIGERGRRASARAAFVMLSGLLIFLPPNSQGAQLSLANAPLFLSSPVKNNIMLIVDDSGSMDSEVLFGTNDGAFWWHTTNQSYTGLDKYDASSAGTINFNRVGAADATWKKFTYLFPNGTATGERIYNDDTNAHYAIPPLPAYAYTRSPTYNKAYFDPTVAYKPWVSYDTTTFSNASTTAANSDPTRGTRTHNLTADITSDTSNWKFKMYEGMTIPAGTYYKDWADSTWKTAAADVALTQERDVPIRYFPATFYLPAGTTKPAGYSSYTATVLTGKAPDGTNMDGYEIKSGNFSDSTQYDNAIQNFANWFSYARKRHMAMRGGVGHAFNGMSNIRTGLYTINNRTTPVTMLDFNTASNTFYSTLYGFVGSGGTPNRQALNHAGLQYMLTGAGAPITDACQQNFSILFTDGYATTDTSSGVGNVDDDAGTYSGTAPYTDSYSNTLADIAMYYYKANLRTDLPADKVPTNADDPNDDPHMVTFAVGLGVKGHIYGVTHNTIADAFTTTPTWQDPTTARDPVQVDDMYHAAINGRGDLLNATTPTDIQTKMRSTLDKIASRTGSAASVAVNSRSLSTETRLYQALFTSGEWSGDLRARSINPTTGVISATDLWSAKTQLIGQNWNTGRAIITRDATKGIPFRWTTSGTDALSATTQTTLKAHPTNTSDPTHNTDARGQAVLYYLRGDSSNETTGTYKFRTRSGSFKLGDIVNSSPIYVGTPPYLPDIESEAHSTFRTSVASRTAMVYVGANDGMLHGFDASTGNEVLAYLPTMAHANLNKLTDPGYSHRYFVDGQPSVGDVFGTFTNVTGTCTTGCWRTVLANGLGAGGKGIFALDVTDPDDAVITGLGFSETNAASLSLWEFTDSATPDDMGHVFGSITITRVKTGTTTAWAAIFGNGYNSVNERAILYVVNIATGALIRKIDLSNGATGTSNGLSTPAVVDVNGDLVADYAYTGDLLGNMWKIDLTDNNSSNWGSYYKKSGNPAPLFKAVNADSTPKAQPITMRPEISSHPDGQSGYMVYFGTGRYIDDSDKTPPDPAPTNPLHSAYGIWDKHSGGSITGSATAAVDRTRLRIQTIGTISSDGITYRTITDNKLGSAGTGDAKTWGDSGSGCNTTGSGNCMGWVEDLPSSGERAVANIVLLGGATPRVIYTTIVPSAVVCDYGGTSWLMEVNPIHGGRVGSDVFDLATTLGDASTALTIGGVNPDVGIMPEPTILRDSSSSRDLKIVTGSSGQVESVINKTGKASGGRQSWRQIK